MHTLSERSEPQPGSLGTGSRSRSAKRRALVIWERFGPAPIDPVPYVPGVTKLRTLLMRPTLLGFAAVMAILVGASQTSSPFTLTKVPGSWYIGIPHAALVPGIMPPPGQGLFVGVVLVYAGMLLLMRAWYDLYRLTRSCPGIPVSKLVPIFILWTLPLLVVAPLFSRDVYSYAAQGEMMSHGISPYAYGPAVLGVNPWVTPVDSLWQNVTSPYGPVFLGLAGFTVTLTGHNELLSIVGMRLLALGGVVLIAAYIPRLARSYGFDGTSAFVLAVLNPLTLLHLIGGAHNDALMVGLLVAGLAVARRGRPVVGAVLVALATAVKVPAAIGLVYIGWEWLGDAAPVRARVRPVLTALLVAVATMLAVSQAVGLGWGWISALGNPDSVKSYLDPPTAVGLFAGRLVQFLGFGAHSNDILAATRAVGLLCAFAIGLKLLLRSDRATSARALGLTLLAVTVLGPVLQPWYLAWSIVVLAAVAEGRIRTLVIGLSCVASFLGLPGGFTLIDELQVANPVLLAAAAAALAAVMVFVFIPKMKRILSPAPLTPPALDPPASRDTGAVPVA